MYMEDADLTRKLAKWGLCLHVPQMEVWHEWRKESHKNQTNNNSCYIIYNLLQKMGYQAILTKERRRT